MITTKNGVKVRKTEACFRSRHAKCKDEGCECRCHKNETTTFERGG